MDDGPVRQDRGKQTGVAQVQPPIQPDRDKASIQHQTPQRLNSVFRVDQPGFGTARPPTTIPDTYAIAAEGPPVPKSKSIRPQDSATEGRHSIRDIFRNPSRSFGSLLGR